MEKICDPLRMNSSPRPAFAGIALLAFSLSAVFAAPVRVVSETAPPAVQPQIAIAPGGAIHLVFGRGSAIFHTRSQDGRAFSPAVKSLNSLNSTFCYSGGVRLSCFGRVISVLHY